VLRRSAGLLSRDVARARSHERHRTDGCRVSSRQHACGTQPRFMTGRRWGSNYAALKLTPAERTPCPSMVCSEQDAGPLRRFR
jgi:hypothetical protein